MEVLTKPDLDSMINYPLPVALVRRQYDVGSSDIPEKRKKKAKNILPGMLCFKGHPCLHGLNEPVLG